MANLFMLVGDTGTGKSTSIATLNPKETFIVNCANKQLPFKGSEKTYNSEAKNIFYTPNAATILSALSKINDEKKEIKNVIIDDAGFIMTELYFAKVNETGFSKFTEIAKQFQSILSYCKSLRSNLNVVIVMHEEDEMSNSIKVKKKPKTIGNLLDSQYSPLSIVSIALFSTVIYSTDGNASYKFITNRTIHNGIEVPAKSPQGMFPDLLIDNDLNYVFNKASEYYN